MPKTIYKVVRVVYVSHSAKEHFFSVSLDIPEDMIMEYVMNVPSKASSLLPHSRLFAFRAVEYAISFAAQQEDAAGISCAVLKCDTEEVEEPNSLWVAPYDASDFWQQIGRDNMDLFARKKHLYGSPWPCGSLWPYGTVWCKELIPKKVVWSTNHDDRV
jgi:hypothetical protein